VAGDPILVAGAGALGSVVGGLLAAAGWPVTLLGRRAHLDAVRARGQTATPTVVTFGNDNNPPAVNFGAAVGRATVVLHAPDGSPLPFMHHLDLSLPFSIMVDQDGQRFCDEAGAYMEIGQRMYRRQKETGKAVPSWVVMDSRQRQYYPYTVCHGGKSWGSNRQASPLRTREKMAVRISR